MHPSSKRDILRDTPPGRTAANSRAKTSLRITGGNLKGRIVSVPPGIIRPAMDRMRESVYAILGDMSGASFLDLFSGSGIMALEAASRGALHLEAVESDKQKHKTLIRNCSVSPFRIQCHLIPVELYVKRTRQIFNYIFCDPPFTYQFKKELLINIGTSCLMNETSLLMIHRPKKETMNLQNKQFFLELQDSRFYGNSAVDFYRKLKTTGNTKKE